jgi:nitrate reductase NapD
VEIEYSAHPPEDDTSHIISMLLMSRPQHQFNIEALIREMPGCEIPGNDDKGRTIVVVEAETNKQLVQRMTQIQDLEHLVSSSLVFHQIA